MVVLREGMRAEGLGGGCVVMAGLGGGGGRLVVSSC